MLFELMEYYGESDVWICAECSLEVSKEQQEEKERMTLLLVPIRDCDRFGGTIEPVCVAYPDLHRVIRKYWEIS